MVLNLIAQQCRLLDPSRLWLRNDHRLGRKEPNMILIGVDYHPGFQTIAFFVEETGECGEQELNHSDGSRENELDQYGRHNPNPPPGRVELFLSE
jgi:hypothetical protein